MAEGPERYRQPERILKDGSRLSLPTGAALMNLGESKDLDELAKRLFRAIWL